MMDRLGSRKMRTLLLTLLALLSGFVAAQDVRPQTDPIFAARYGIDLNAPAIYLNYDDGLRGFVVGISVVENDDVYFHMSGPVTSSWIGIGFGSEMKDTLMIVAYPASNGHNLTLSPRIGTGHTEPAVSPDHSIIPVWTDLYAPAANTITGAGAINSHAICVGCAKWPGGGLDRNNKNQPFFFAMGPNKTFTSDSVNANIALHAGHAVFYGDMTKATNFTGNYTRIPAPNVPHFAYPPTDAAFATFGMLEPTDVIYQDYHTSGLHGWIMCFVFVVVFPFGALVKLILRNVVWHGTIQGIGAILVIIGFVLAVQVSKLYLRSKDYNSGHQILGLIVLSGVIVQAGMGLVHHAIFMRTRSPTPLGRIHMFLGPLVMFLGLVNGGLGFRFAGYWELNLAYGPVVGGLGVVFIGFLACILYIKNRRKAYKAEVDYEGPVFGHVSGGYHDLEMKNASPEPQEFGQMPPTPYEPPTPFGAQTLSYLPPDPYAPVQPYTPMTAYMPDTPKTFKKMHISEYPLDGHN